MALRQFCFRWPCEVSQLLRCHFGDKVYSPIYRTVDSNVGFDWKMYVTPAGGMFRNQRMRDTVGFYIEFQPSDLFSHPPLATGTLYVERQGKVDPESCVYFSFTQRNPIENTRGCPAFLPRVNSRTFQAEDLIEDGMLVFAVFIEIPAYPLSAREQFTYSSVLLKERQKLEGHNPHAKFGSIFKQCQVISGDDEESVAAEQILNPTAFQEDQDHGLPPAKIEKLDFKIVTKDGKKITCHGVVLNENSFFSTMFASEMKEADEGEITFPDLESDLVLELVHYIYRGQVSKNFSIKSHQDLDLYGLLNGADRLVLPGFKLSIEEWLVEQKKMEVGNAAQLLTLACQFNMKVLKEATINFAAENVMAIRKSEAGKHLDDHLWDEILEVTEKRMRAPKVPCSPILRLKSEHQEY